MPLPLGTWRMIANGSASDLMITSVSAAGVLNGTLGVRPSTGAYMIKGFWEEASQELTFTLVLMPMDPEAPVRPILYKGYLFSVPAIPEPGQDVHWTLAGFFQILDNASSWLPDTKVSSRRNTFGWYAQIDVVV